MYLHDDRKEFADLIDECNKRMMIGEALIEKDYYVTMFLKHLYEAEPNIVFKGGTCLSKCFKLIDRFSEDIDISMPPASSKRQKKNLKYHIVEVANELGLRHLNADMIRSGRSYAEHRVAFPAAFKSGKIDPVLLIETYFRPTALPTLTLPVSSFLHDHLKEKGTESAISKYNLEPFDINVQSLKLTLVDKLYALNTYYLKGRIDARSRHLYDIHKILPHVVFDKEFFDLLAEIGEKERNDFKKMREPVDFDPSGLAGSLREIVDEETYRNDYENNTMPLLFDRTPYDDVIASLLSVIDEIDVEEGEFFIDEVLPMDIRRTSAVSPPVPYP